MTDRTAPPPATAPDPPAPIAGWRGRVARWRRFLPALAFVAGFAYDAATLRRIDQRLDNYLLLAYLLALGVAIGLDRRIAVGRLRSPFVLRHHDKLKLLAQFLQGGLFSAYVIFYTRSASAWTSVLWLIALLAVMVVNEFREGWLAAQRIRLLLFVFSSWSLFLFFLPVVLATGWLVSVAGAVAATLLLTAGVLVIAHAGPRPGAAHAVAPDGAAAVAALVPDPAASAVPLSGHLRRGVLEAAAVVGVLLGLEWAGVTPPVPLAVVEAGFFHDVRKEGGDYVVQYRKPPLWAPWRQDDRPYLWVEGDAVHCLTAVFAPRGMKVPLYHRWERWQEGAGWVQTDRIEMTISGGREHGWRGRSQKARVGPGRWRVVVEREDGRQIARLRFDIEPDPAAERAWAERRI